MKKTTLILIVILSVLLCACSDDETIDSKYFSTVMSEKGFTVEDHTEYLDPSLPENRDAEQIKAWGSYFVCFEKYHDSETAESIMDLHENYYKVTDADRKLSLNSNYMYFTYTDYDGNSKVFIASRVDNTIVLAEASLDFAEAAEGLLEELGYGS